MTAKSPSPPASAQKQQPCKHPRVQIVSRDEDSEFVECKECGEIFESSEFKDMSIEERTRNPEP
jgi:transcription initiation factor TFIIIB Brf1 subunit/transcription initiation factor TFIIB